MVTSLPTWPARASSSLVIPIPSTLGSTASKSLASLASRSDPDAGVSPLFPPKFQSADDAKQELLHVVRRDPHQLGVERTRWSLESIRLVCDWLGKITPGGLSQLLKRLEIGWKGARAHIHSPDPNYLAKLADIAVQVGRRQACGGRIVTMYMDELSFYRQPTIAKAYEERGRLPRPLAELSYQSNTPTRIVGALDVYDGRVVYLQCNLVSVSRMVAFYKHVCAAYPEAERINLVMDNWPQHFHPDVLVALEPQETRWPRNLPPRWRRDPSEEAVRRWGELKLPIQALPLPTYASWTNPIEKLWRKLKQDYLHLHRLADRLDQLREGVAQFLDQFADGSHDLLRYVGLTRTVSIC